MSDVAALKQAIDGVRSDPRLGRSPLVRRLFDYLAESSLAGRSPKETEVAIEVFGRRADFDASRDAVARVYVHKLRKRLEHIGGLTIPRGEYRLVPASADAAESPHAPTLSGAWKRIAIPAVAGGLVAAALGFGGAWGIFSAKHDPPPSILAARNPIWRAVIENGKPTIVALGDYYIFAQMPQDGGDIRLVREYTVNSAAELDRFIREHPARSAGYTDLGLSYLPVGGAGAVMSVTRALSSAKDVKVMPVSELTPRMLRDNNIVYIGFLSGLGILRDATFAGSRFSIGENYDAIIDNLASERFESGGGVRQPDGAIYPDYGYVSTFAGPTGNRFVIIAGTRDAALMQMGQTATSPIALEDLSRVGGKSMAAEALYAIDGMNRINVSSRLVRSAPLNQAAIWRDDAESERSFPRE